MPILSSPDLKRFDGHYLIYRKTAKGLNRKVAGVHFPRFRHERFEAAEAEAIRLHALHPESTFVIMHEVARVKSVDAALAVAA